MLSAKVSIDIHKTKLEFSGSKQEIESFLEKIQEGARWDPMVLSLVEIDSLKNIKKQLEVLK